MEIIRDNWVDLALALILGWYAFQGVKRGFIVSALEFCAFVGSFAAALLAYGAAADLLVAHAGIARPFAKPIAFFVCWAFAEYLLNIAAYRLYAKLPDRYVKAAINRTLGALPSVLDGALLSAVILSLVVALPVPAAVKRDVLDARVGGPLVRAADGLDEAVASIFGGAAKETLNFLTVRQGSGESVDLRFTTREFVADPQAEARMLELVNAARRERGLRPLVADASITAVARAHSADMLRRGYFSHVNPDGADPTDRADAAGIRYAAFGENLAFAPDVSLAHSGLMNSAGHRANILSPHFGRIGIGIQDAGVYGLMITQNFAD